MYYAGTLWNSLDCSNSENNWFISNVNGDIAAAGSHPLYLLLHLVFLLRRCKLAAGHLCTMREHSRSPCAAQGHLIHVLRQGWNWHHINRFPVGGIPFHHHPFSGIYSHSSCWESCSVDSQWNSDVFCFFLLPWLDFPELRKMDSSETTEWWRWCWSSSHFTLQNKDLSDRK